MDFNDILYKLKKYCVSYFDLKDEIGRKEFNFGILLYSILFIASMFAVTDTTELNNVLKNEVADLQYQAYDGRISEQEAAEKAMSSVQHLIPTLYMNIFALLLLPLYIRRLNDTKLQTWPMVIPVIIVYCYDVAHTLFNLQGTFYLYNGMSFYAFILAGVLCFIPSKKDDQETEGY